VRAVAQQVLLGALGGACAALLAVWSLGAHPGRTDDELDALRLQLNTENARHVASLAAISERLDALEARPVDGGAEDATARASVAAVAEDLGPLRDALRNELMVIDDELARLGEIVEDVAGGVGGADPAGPLSPEDEPRWVVLSADPEPGVRFSALVRLGRARTDRSVQASIARLDDPEDEVVWQALRNLGQFRERAAAAQVAALLTHGSPVVRAAAYDALLRMGAPGDSGYDPVGAADERERAAEKLRAWAEES